ncbi:hypothetical protein O5O45_12810 [Hahella aquimaris]|uniref:hypothetical protein n=1 Tax=Hahella sp. HNIBRBA332 TaxID=3015983 RepID=UPI00273C2BE9|nr:hypothetical protein [Hahella sp. HNIBRBA332]WLQ16800.1 hypothetical protein O5O45_12810 [Hahella sp. HNIBRBA332]
MSRHIRAWESFCEHIFSIEVERLSASEFYVHICNWLKKSKFLFDRYLWDLYGFEFYLNIDIGEYVVECCDCRESKESVRWKSMQPSSMSGIAVIVRDVLWSIVTFQSERMCPRCGDDVLCILINELDDELVYFCNLCCWAELSSGQQWLGEEKLIPVTIKKLGEKGVLINN